MIARAHMRIVRKRGYRRGAARALGHVCLAWPGLAWPRLASPRLAWPRLASNFMGLTPRMSLYMLEALECDFSATGLELPPASLP